MERQRVINGVSVSLTNGSAIDQQVDLVMNPANGLLLMRTGTAKSIREASGELDDDGREEYYELLDEFSALVMRKYIQTFGVEDWEPRQAQLSCFRKIVEHSGPFDVGEVILDTEWSTTKAKDVLHIVCSAYYMSGEDLETTRIDEKTLHSIVRQALTVADENSYRSVAIPVLCTEGRYGISSQASLRTILAAIKESDLSSVQEILVCFEDTGPRALYDRMDEEAIEGFMV